MFLLAKCDPTILYPLMLQRVLSLLIIFINHIGIRHTMFLNKHILNTSEAEPLEVCWLALRIYSFVNYLFCTWFIFLFLLLLLLLLTFSHQYVKAYFILKLLISHMYGEYSPQSFIIEFGYSTFCHWNTFLNIYVDTCL